MRGLAALAFGLIVACCFACAGTERRAPPRGGREPQETRPAQQAGAPGESVDRLEPQRIEIGPHEAVVEVAADHVTRGRGLSGRAELPEDHGMIFVYGSSRYRSFWMKDCRIGLDIAFLDDDGRIMQIGSADAPEPDDDDVPRVRSEVPARYVLEMRKGWFSEHGIMPGVRVALTPAIRETARRLARSEGS